MHGKHEIRTTFGPLANIDAWDQDYYGIAECTLPVLHGGRHSTVGTLAAHVAKALDELPEETLVKAFDGAPITFIGRGKVASIFLIGEISEGKNDALIATVSRCSVSNELVESEFRNLFELSKTVQDNDFFRSLPTSTFKIPELVTLIKSSEDTPALYFSKLVTGATAYPDLSNREYNYGFTSFKLESTIGMDHPSISDDPGLKKSDQGEIDDETYYLLRNKGKQVLEDLAYYLLGSAHLTKNVSSPELGWGDLMISPTDPPTLTLTSFRKVPIDKDASAVIEQFCTLLIASIGHDINSPNPQMVPVFPTRVLMRALNKFLDSEALNFDERQKLELLTGIKDHLSTFDLDSIIDLNLINHLKRAKDYVISFLEHRLKN